jgi:hypothetical protein
LFLICIINAPHSHGTPSAQFKRKSVFFRLISIPENAAFSAIANSQKEATRENRRNRTSGICGGVLF